ncbi:MAG: hypothetical protein FWD55_01615 [Propionibacteriaceae bacterium]|nr:hypothetical protein [Propionibacteriaceae bacterium]
MFDDSLLDDPLALSVRGAPITKLALTGARLRSQDSTEMASIVVRLASVTPRTIIVVGSEARLIRAVVEPTGPVPTVAWTSPTLPAWTGPLDLVIILAGSNDRFLPTCREALKRGSLLFMVAPAHSPIIEECPSVPTLTTQEDDRFVGALLALKILDLLNVGPSLNVDTIANVLDEIAEKYGPRHGLEDNYAKNLACALADAVPLVVGRSVLAARASRRVAEALREATGLPALAADDEALRPLIESSHPRDLFADPFEDRSPHLDFCLLILDDGKSELDEDLVRIAQGHSVRVEKITYTHDNPVIRYAGLLHQGLFAAAYLGLATIKE